MCVQKSLLDPPNSPPTPAVAAQEQEQEQEDEQEDEENSVPATPSDDDDVPLQPFAASAATRISPRKKPAQPQSQSKRAHVDTESDGEEDLSQAASACKKQKQQKQNDHAGPPPRANHQLVPSSGLKAKSAKSAKTSTGELTNYLFPCLIAKFGFDGPASVVTDHSKRELIQFILSKQSSIELSIDDIDFKKLNDTLLKHMQRFRKNASKAAGMLLLEQSNPKVDPHLAWALVIARAIARAHTHLISKFPLTHSRRRNWEFLQEAI